MNNSSQNADRKSHFGPDAVFYGWMALPGAAYLLLLLAMLAAMLAFTSPDHFAQAFQSPEIRYAVVLSLASATLSALLSIWVATPLGYLLARTHFRGKQLVDALVDIPIVLPPLVVGLGLLLLFQTPAGRAVEAWMPVAYAIPGVVIAQFTVACAFAVRAMRASFEQLDPRAERVALTLGCTRRQAFFRIALPGAKSGLITAVGLAWARSVGEFGPILVFAGATRMRTEVLPTSIFLELSVGNIESAVAVSLLMLLGASCLLGLLRLLGAGLTPNSSAPASLSAAARRGSKHQKSPDEH